MISRVNKNSATIKLESKKEVKAFADFIEHYMEVSFEEEDEDGELSSTDSIALALDKKFNKEKYQ